MSHPARVTLAPDQPDGVLVVEVVPADRRLVAGLESGPDSQSTYLGDAILRVADQFDWPVVLDMRAVDWIDSGACAVLIKFWKELRGKGRTLTLCVTDPVSETFRITGLARLIPCFGERAPAIEAARIAPPPAAVEKPA
jgi:anti-anti-sigma factor